MPVASLVKMANEIVANQRYRERTDAVDSIARHLKSYWAPSMIRDLHDHITAGATDVDPIAVEAVNQIAQ